MTSRRPMTRSYSGNGRTSSFSEEEGSIASSRSESRNTYLSNVRPENRSTLCSVMAQLTEDIQPTFETTLKSKAVSENCNVKFTCVVSGYPAPELKWYKDDVEMDRYCGLPKYEIHRKGKTHTLHIYNCTLDDAAIYQVSASNSKGIVSCSGVLEVGTMNEFKIHQRFFAKLKQKGEKKKKDLDVHTKKEDKENIQRAKPHSSPDHLHRKRPVPSTEERAVVNSSVAVEQPADAAVPNGISSEVRETETLTSMNSSLENEVSPSEEALDKKRITETLTSMNSSLENEVSLSEEPLDKKRITETLISMNSSLENEVSPSEETLDKKRIKMSNSVDDGVTSSNNGSSSRSHVMGNGGENCYDGGISLAQFLAETLQSQTADENQSSPQEEEAKQVDTAVVPDHKEKDQEELEKTSQEEREREKRKEEELATERAKEAEKQLEMVNTPAHSRHSSEVKHHSKGHKDQDHHNIQASLSTMLHTVKDFFFGKNKKDFHEHSEKESNYSDITYQPPHSDMPPSFCLNMEHNPEVFKPSTEDLIMPMAVDKTEEPSETMDLEQRSASLKCEENVLHTHETPDSKVPPETVEESALKSVAKVDDAVEAMEVSVEPESSNAGEDKSLPGLQVHTEAEDKDTKVVSVIKEVLMQQQELEHLAFVPQPPPQAGGEEFPTTENKSVLPHASAPAADDCALNLPFTTLEKRRTPPPSFSSAKDSPRVLSGTLQKEKTTGDKMDKEREPVTEEDCFSNKFYAEEKTEVKLNKHPHSDINRSEVPKLSASLLEDGIEPCESITPYQVLSPLHAVVGCKSEANHLKEETKCTSLIQEMTVGLPLTAEPEGLIKGDLKTQHDCTPSVVEQLSDVHNDKVIQGSNSGSTCSVEELKEALDCVVEKNVEKNVCNSLKTQEQATVKGVISETRDESLLLEYQKEEKTPLNVEESKESNTVTQSNESNVNLKEIHSDISHQNSSESGWTAEPGSPSEKAPSIKISAIEDIPEIKTSVSDVSPNEHFIIPKIEIDEPDVKECTLPLTILALDKPGPTNLLKHDANLESNIGIQIESMTESPGVFPIQRDVQNIQKVKEVAQEMLEQQQPNVQTNEALPQLDFVSFPDMNVSGSDIKEGDVFVSNEASNTKPDSETSRVPLFVVPPISVTCHESDVELQLPPHSKRLETETSVGTQRGTMRSAGHDMTAKPEMTRRAENTEETSEKKTRENAPAAIHEPLTPKVGGHVPLLGKPVENNTVPETLKPNSSKEIKADSSVSVEDFLKNKLSVERLSSKPPTYPSLSPASLRKFMSKAAPDSDNESATAVPVISVSDRQSDKPDEDVSGGSTPTSSLSCESSPRLKRRDSLTLIRSATPEELASGARRKIFIPRAKEDTEAAMVGMLEGKKDSPYMSPSQARRAALLQASTGQTTPPMERRSPLLSRRKATLEVPKVVEETSAGEPASTKKEEKPAEKKIDPLKAPQVIRKIRGEPFPDASGHLKLWCQFFNVLSDSTIKWYKDEVEILQEKRSGSDESQVALAIVQASRQDCAVYGCTISNEYGTDTTDFLLSEDILSEMLLKDDFQVGEEIELTPMVFTKGLADSGSWGEKYFGRILTDTLQLGEGCTHKTSRAKVIYGLDPVFESGSTCIMKIRNPIAYGTKEERNLTERNMEITKQELKVQNMIREYCKIFSAEARVVENFGFSLEVLPRYLMYRPGNSVPYATVETDLAGVFVKYCMMDLKGKLITQNTSELEQKCCTFQHWIHQWTHGNLLVTQLEGVETKISNIKIVTKSKGYQGLTELASPEVFEQFLTQHQCNYYCGLLALRPLKTADSLQQPSKIKGSRSPLLNRKLGSGSPQLQRKAYSPQMSRKANSSPKVQRKVQETKDSKSGGKSPAESLSVVEIR
ncbi:titin homolog isoform X2 [Cololabis saira]|uniref:titin homolog isoform X2 n=1 Tax=Cololabis saira TaxID=129043 RepID=UPI002AD35655|nr:titin homolog isoform X2 [Cololabis saira]